jgi:MFS family permease
MQDMGAAWLMTTLTPSPVLIALVQAATSLPVFFLAIPAGALADIVERRRILLVSNLWALASVAALTYFTLTARISPGILLALTFSVGIGATFEAPALQAVVTELVPHAELPMAVALNSAGYNLARAVGPAFGGIVLARLGAGVNFLLNSLTFFVVLVVLYRWREEHRKSVLPAERFSGALRAGIRYVAYAPELQAVLVRTGAFILFGDALWALLPVIVRMAGHGPSAYGLLLAALGAGALIGAACLPYVKHRVSLDRLVIAGTVLFGSVTLTAGFSLHISILAGIMVVGGFAWILLISSLNVATRMVVPSWVQARCLSVYLLVLQGGMAFGSFGWGLLAENVGARWSLVWAGAGLLTTVGLARSYGFQSGLALDLKPAGQWPDPEISPDESAITNPVLVTIEYEIDLNDADRFACEMRALEQIRRRDGALQWGLFIDPAGPGKYLEEFLVETWIEHLRQHERFTVADQQVLDQIIAMHKGSEPPRVTHYIADERAT